MEGYTEWEYYIAKDLFHLYFPEGEYNIYTLAEWYKVIPTKAEKIAYYGDRVDLLKQHFEQLVTCSDIKTKITNDIHSNAILNIWCLTIYNVEGELVGFAAQEVEEYLTKGSIKGEKKIIFFNELKR